MTLEPETVVELAKMDNIIGIKDSSGSFENIKKYIEITKDEKFSVLAGTDSLILKTLMAGERSYSSYFKHDTGYSCCHISKLA